MKRILFPALSIALIFGACKKENEPEHEHEEELITTVQLEFTSPNNEVATFTYRDLDGDGADTAQIISDTLMANTTYSVKVKFLNESESPAEDITEEVKEEGLDHQVFYMIGTPLNLSFTYQDVDAEQNPIGLETEFTTGITSHGLLGVILRHEPNKSAAGVADGDISNAGGETDVEVNFHVHIE